MSADKLSANISLKPPRVPLNEHLLKTALSEVFPLFSIKFQRDLKKQDYSMNVRVGSKLYDYLAGSSFTEDLVFYTVPASSQLGFWTPDMNVGFRLLSAVGIVEEIGSWMITARDSLTNFMNGDKVNSVKKDPKALKQAEAMLKAFGILNVVDTNTILPMIVKNVIESKRMDPTTIIFRLAMAIYHAKAYTDDVVIGEVEDPSTLYLKLTQSDFFQENESKLKLLTKLPAEGINQVMKFVVVMTIASYVYHKVARGGN